MYKIEALEMLEEVEANLPMLILERDGQDVKCLNAKIPADVVNGLHIFAGWMLRTHRIFSADIFP